MNKYATIAMSIAAVAGGAGLVILADQQGWLGGSSSVETGQEARVSEQPQANAPARERPGVEPVIQLVRQVAEGPRWQRTPSASCEKTNTLVQFKNADVAAKAGLELIKAQRRPITRTVECNAELAFNGDRLAHLSPRAPGVVHRIEKTLGDRVAAGDTLAIIDSAELGAAKAEFLHAKALVNLWEQNHQRQSALAKDGIVPQRDLLDTQTRLAESNIAFARSEQRLRNLGLSEAAIDDTFTSGNASSQLPIVAPFDGLIVERHAVLGEVVDTNTTLYTIADTSKVWALLDLHEADAAQIEIGQPVMLSLSGLPGEAVGGRIAWISPQIDPATRTLKVRAEVDNLESRLRANMFGRATITVHDREELLVVPSEAVQWEGCCNVVFVKKTDSIYQPRKVRLGAQVDDWFVIQDGLEGDELVVTRGSFLMKTEILKGSIGAGCCEVH